MIDPPPYRYWYLHGFGSDRNSTKGVELRRRCSDAGVDLELLDVNVPTFETQTYSQILAYLDELDRDRPAGRPLRIGGSSMGGYLAALWAERNPARVDRLFLLCPGFGLIDRLPELVGESEFAAWERDRSPLAFADFDGRNRTLHWDFVVDALRYPTHPVVPCPTRILHGRQDETVPVESSRDYAAAHDRVELIEVDDGHRLESSMKLVTQEFLRFMVR